MKSRDVFGVAVPAVVLFLVALLGACTTTNLASNRTGWSDYATVAIKDYTVVGIVRVVSEDHPAAFLASPIPTRVRRSPMTCSQ